MNETLLSYITGQQLCLPSLCKQTKVGVVVTVGNKFMNQFVNSVHQIFMYTHPLRNHRGRSYDKGCCCRFSVGDVRDTTDAVAILPSVSVSPENRETGSGSVLRSAEDMQGDYF